MVYHSRNFVPNAEIRGLESGLVKELVTSNHSDIILHSRSLKQRGFQYVNTWETDGAMEGIA